MPRHSRFLHETLAEKQQVNDRLERRCMGPLAKTNFTELPMVWKEIVTENTFTSGPIDWIARAIQRSGFFRSDDLFNYTDDIRPIRLGFKNVVYL